MVSTVIAILSPRYGDEVRRFVILVLKYLSLIISTWTNWKMYRKAMVKRNRSNLERTAVDRGISYLVNISTTDVVASWSEKVSDRTLAPDVSLEARTNSGIGHKRVFVVILSLRW
jgi:hypothetical protein